MEQRGELIGILTREERLVGIMSIAGEPILIAPDIYEGDYIVTPRAHRETILETRMKTLTDDVKVLEVPYFEVSNVNGKTAYIAQEVDING